MGLRESVQTAVAAVTDPRDQAAVDLAVQYATEIDMGMDLGKLGPLLLAALEALLLSPRARAAATKAVTHDKPVANPLDQLSDRRLRRGRTADLDATAEGSV